MQTENWSVTDITGSKYIGIIEFEINNEWHYFDIYETNSKLVFGGHCNVGFLESGYIYKDGFSCGKETLQALLEDLYIYYTQGIEHCNGIICNERM